jgi:hypothetical protein
MTEDIIYTGQRAEAFDVNVSRQLFRHTHHICMYHRSRNQRVVSRRHSCYHKKSNYREHFSILTLLHVVIYINKSAHWGDEDSFTGPLVHGIFGLYVRETNHEGYCSNA